MSDYEKLVEATRLWQEGCRRLSENDLEGALGLYTRSIEAYPTAEGYTFRGWAMSFQDRFDEAIEECLKAIELDPTFGNPYNDIGCYLMEQGKLDQAIEWLQKAKLATRYESPHFPCLNLGRIYITKEMYSAALGEFEQALQLQPDDSMARAAIDALRSVIN
jgi:tetratricopeptide (TPR) repeat protein